LQDKQINKNLLIILI